MIEPAGDTAPGHVDWAAAREALAVHGESLLARSARRSIMPSQEEAAAFVREYEAARGREFGAAERETLRAAALYATAYTARCEHARDARTADSSAPT